MNYSEIKNYCEANSVLSGVLIDDFLIHYAADRENLLPLMETQLKKYKKAVREIPVSYRNFLKSEYIAHRIFREEGYISKYLSRSEIKNLPLEQYKYLEFQSRNSWRFSFGEIKHTPAAAFFEMEDVITGEVYLLYSPGMQTMEKKQHPRTWFNLIAYNGKCWQTFGLIIPFQSFTADDIFFFATELNPGIEDGLTLMQEVENNPFPFFMLLSASNVPVIAARGHETMHFQATDFLENFSTETLSAYFTKAWNKNVYQLTSKEMGEFPHFAVAYYHEQEKVLIRTAMTEVGFEGLTQALEKVGFPLNPEADVVVTPGMLSAARKILDRKIALHSYENLFSKRRDEAETEELKRINHFLKLALPFYNAQKEPDLKRLAERAGIKPETAAEVWGKTKGSMDKARNKERP